MDYCSDENFHSYVLEYGKARYQSENSVRLYELLKLAHLDEKLALIENQSFLASPTTLKTSYSRDIRTGGTPMWWLWVNQRV